MRVKYWLATIILVFLSFSVMVSATKTVKTVEIPFGLVKNAPADMNLEKNISFNPPDGITEIISAEMILKGDFASFTDVAGFITKNYHECTPSEITTPATDVYNYDVIFDCSKFATNYRGGDVLAMFNLTKSAKNLCGRYRITYYNNPLPQMSIGTTEYSVGADGKVFLQLLDNDYKPIDNASCFLDIYFPNDTIFISDYVMNHLTKGVYYYNLTVPNHIGVYMVLVTCHIPSYTYYDYFDDYSKLESYENITISGGKVMLSENMSANCSGTCADCSLRNESDCHDGCAWNPPVCSGSFFEKCKNITISNVGNSLLTDFPAYINLTYDSDMLPNYRDLRFYNTSCNNGGSLLDYEIENYTVSNADIWLRIPSLPVAGTVISVYYKNITQVSSGENPTGVWDDNYVMVQHLEETSGIHYDSTAYGNNATNYYSVQNAIGKIGGANRFNGVDARLRIENSTSLDLTTKNYTIEAWINASTVGLDGWAVIYADGSWRLSFGIGIEDNPDKLEYWINSFGNGASLSDVLFGQWTYGAMTFNGSNMNFFQNGTPDGSSVASSYTNPTTKRIGGITGQPYSFYLGYIDEVRISNIARSVDWINQSYQLVANQDAFVIIGSEENWTSCASYSEQSSCESQLGCGWLFGNCSGTCIPCTNYTNGTSCSNQSGCSWNYEINYTTGFIQSEAINLSIDTWLNYSANYNGSVLWYILNDANATLCSALGDVSSCANDTTPIHLRAELTTGSEIDSWRIIAGVENHIDEIRGAGEIHVSSEVGLGDLWAEFLTSVEAVEDEQTICLDNHTLQRRKMVNIDSSSGNNTYWRTEEYNCTYGCQGNACNPHPIQRSLSLIGIVLLILVLSYAVWRYH